MVERRERGGGRWCKVSRNVSESASTLTDNVARSHRDSVSASTLKPKLVSDLI